MPEVKTDKLRINIIFPFLLFMTSIVKRCEALCLTAENAECSPGSCTSLIGGIQCYCSHTNYAGVRCERCEDPACANDRCSFDEVWGTAYHSDFTTIDVNILLSDPSYSNPPEVYNFGRIDSASACGSLCEVEERCAAFTHFSSTRESLPESLRGLCVGRNHDSDYYEPYTGATSYTRTCHQSGSTFVYNSDCASNPCGNGGTCSDGVGGYTCSCAADYTGSQCETYEDPCTSNPCGNGGTCTDVDGGYVCSCAADYTGSQCETYEDSGACSSNPCENGGTCTDVGGGYSCSCAADYTGSQCETYENSGACSSNPCGNGGTCTEADVGYSCSCAADYTGSQCETYEDSGACSSNPCENGGTCTEAGVGYSCSCAADYTGSQCEIYESSDPCTPNPCGSGGTCTDVGDGYVCSCAADYTGSQCETYEGSDPCTSNPCENGGTCTDVGDGYVCSCAADYTGSQCETYEGSSDACSGVTCHNGGTCINHGAGAYECQCETFYTGDECETEVDYVSLFITDRMEYFVQREETSYDGDSECTGAQSIAALRDHFTHSFVVTYMQIQNISLSSGAWVGLTYDSVHSQWRWSDCQVLSDQSLWANTADPATQTGPVFINAQGKLEIDTDGNVNRRHICYAPHNDSACSLIDYSDDKQLCAIQTSSDVSEARATELCAANHMSLVEIRNESSRDFLQNTCMMEKLRNIGCSDSERFSFYLGLRRLTDGSSYFWQSDNTTMEWSDFVDGDTADANEYAHSADVCDNLKWTRRDWRSTATEAQFVICELLYIPFSWDAATNSMYYSTIQAGFDNSSYLFDNDETTCVYTDNSDSNPFIALEFDQQGTLDWLSIYVYHDTSVEEYNPNNERLSILLTDQSNIQNSMDNSQFTSYQTCATVQLDTKGNTIQCDTGASGRTLVLARFLDSGTDDIKICELKLFGTTSSIVVIGSTEVTLETTAMPVGQTTTTLAGPTAAGPTTAGPAGQTAAGPAGPTAAGPAGPTAAGPVGPTAAGPAGPTTAVPAGPTAAGPAGPTTAGPAGPTVAGPAGPTTAGPAGPTVAGPAGPTAVGPAGPTVVGPAGPTAAGPAGPTAAGPAGPTAVGPAGPTVVGPAGPTAAGPAGPTAAGPAGPTAAGPASATVAGPAGLTTAGPAGPTAAGPAGPTAAGPAGPTAAGPAGPTVAGTAGPTVAATFTANDDFSTVSAPANPCQNGGTDWFGHCLCPSDYTGPACETAIYGSDAYTTLVNQRYAYTDAITACAAMGGHVSVSNVVNGDVTTALETAFLGLSPVSGTLPGAWTGIRLDNHRNGERSNGEIVANTTLESLYPAWFPDFEVDKCLIAYSPSPYQLALKTEACDSTNYSYCEIQDSSASPCSVNPCENSGECVVLSNTAHCVCPTGTRGSTCEHAAATEIEYSGSNTATWEDANTDCAARGGHLVDILDDMDLAVVLGNDTAITCSETNSIWIGLKRDTDRHPAWTDGRYMDWFSGSEGDDVTAERCFALLVPQGILVAIPCTRNLSYICQNPHSVAATSCAGDNTLACNIQGSSECRCVPPAVMDAEGQCDTITQQCSLYPCGQYGTCEDAWVTVNEASFVCNCDDGYYNENCTDNLGYGNLFYVIGGLDASANTQVPADNWWNATSACQSNDLFLADTFDLEQVKEAMITAGISEMWVGGTVYHGYGMLSPDLRRSKIMHHDSNFTSSLRNTVADSVAGTYSDAECVFVSYATSDDFPEFDLADCWDEKYYICESDWSLCENMNCAHGECHMLDGRPHCACAAGYSGYLCDHADSEPFTFMNDYATFADAATECSDRGGYLFDFSDENQLTPIMDQAHNDMNYFPVWLGLKVYAHYGSYWFNTNNDIKREFFSILSDSDLPFEFHNPSNSIPAGEEYCLVLLDDGNLEPWDCTNVLYFVCEGVATDYCSSAPCQNGGICVPHRFDVYCVCPQRYAGKYCERESVQNAMLFTTPTDWHTANQTCADNGMHIIDFYNDTDYQSLFVALPFNPLWVGFLYSCADFITTYDGAFVNNMNWIDSSDYSSMITSSLTQTTPSSVTCVYIADSNGTLDSGDCSTERVFICEGAEDPCSGDPCDHGDCYNMNQDFYCHCHSGWRGANCDSAAEGTLTLMTTPLPPGDASAHCQTLQMWLADFDTETEYLNVRDFFNASGFGDVYIGLYTSDIFWRWAGDNRIATWTHFYDTNITAGDYSSTTYVKMRENDLKWEVMANADPVWFFCEADVTSPCDSNPCQNGGTCAVLNTHVTCTCVIGTWGDFCDNQTTTTNLASGATSLMNNGDTGDILTDGVLNTLRADYLSGLIWWQMELGNQFVTHVILTVLGSDMTGMQIDMIGTSYAVDASQALTGNCASGVDLTIGRSTEVECSNRIRDAFLVIKVTVGELKLSEVQVYDLGEDVTTTSSPIDVTTTSSPIDVTTISSPIGVTTTSSPIATDGTTEGAETVTSLAIAVAAVSQSAAEVTTVELPEDLVEVFEVVEIEPSEIECPIPPDFPHSSRIMYVNTEGNTAVRYTCDLGFSYENQVFEKTLTCEDGVWTEDFADCTSPLSSASGDITITFVSVSCVMPHFRHASPVPVTYRAQYSDQVVFHCDAGYELRVDSRTMYTGYCDAYGTWADSVTDCQEIRCSRDEAEYSVGEVFTEQCEAGTVTVLGLHFIESQCQPDGTWSTSVESCQDNRCGTPLLFSHTRVNYTSVDHGSIATYTCMFGSRFATGDAHHNDDDEKHMTCVSGEWQGDAQKCHEFDCGPPPILSNGTRDTSEALLGTIITYTCDDNFDFADGSTEFTIECLITELWSDTPPHCEEIRCPQLSAIPHTDIDDPAGLTRPSHSVGTIHTFTCHDNYRFVDGRTVADKTCDATGTWIGIDQGADTNRCAVIPEVAHVIPQDGAIVSDMGNTETLLCETGYRFTDGSASVDVTCNPDLSWEGNIPECEAILCPELSDPPHGSLNSTDYGYGTVVELACDTGHEIAEEVSNITAICLEDGEWSVNITNLTCSAVHCPPAPYVANATSRDDVTRTSYGVEIAYECPLGYYTGTLGIRTASVRCEADKQWSNRPEPCLMVECPSLPLWAGTEANTTSWLYGTHVNYYCSEHFQFPDSRPTGYTYCNQHGEWVPEVVNCVALQQATYSETSEVAESDSGAALAIPLMIVIAILMTALLAADIVFITPEIIALLRDLHSMVIRVKMGSNSMIPPGSEPNPDQPIRSESAGTGGSDCAVECIEQPLIGGSAAVTSATIVPSQLNNPGPIVPSQSNNPVPSVSPPQAPPPIQGTQQVSSPPPPPQQKPATPPKPTSWHDPLPSHLQSLTYQDRPISGRHITDKAFQPT